MKFDTFCPKCQKVQTFQICDEDLMFLLPDGKLKLRCLCGNEWIADHSDLPPLKEHQKKGLRKNMTEILNAKITHADLSMADHGVLCYSLTLEGRGWGCNFGGVVIGHGYLGAKKFIGYAKGIEAIMKIMDTVGVERWSDLTGKYVRCVSDGWGKSIEKIGNIIYDKWFDQKEFFNERGKDDT